MEQIIITFAFFAIFVISAIKLLTGRVQIQTAQSLEVIDELHEPLQILWLMPNLFKDLQLTALRRIAKKDSAEINHLRTLDQKLEVFFKYKNSKAVNQHKDIDQETIKLISIAVLAEIMESLAEENFADTTESYNRVKESGRTYPPTKEMYNKIQNFFELTPYDVNSQNMYAEFKRKYRN
jgi:hypothetical protein